MSEGCKPQTNLAVRLSVIILAGGRGRRLGGDKADVLLGDESLLSRAVRRARALSDDLVVVTRREQQVVHRPTDVCWTSDIAGQEGVLAGITAGLKACRNGWALCIACDMPFVDPAVVRLLTLKTTGVDVVIPEHRLGLEPLHALYHRRCLSAMEACLRGGARRPIIFLESMRVAKVEQGAIEILDPTWRSFYNINTPEEMDRAREWIAP